MGDSPSDPLRDQDWLRERRQQLEDRLVALERGAAAGSAAAVVELDQSKVGRLSRMDAMQHQAVALAAERRQVEERRAVQRALARLDRDEYGECLACGEDIAPARLASSPAATLCISCAETAEQS